MADDKTRSGNDQSVLLAIQDLKSTLSQEIAKLKEHDPFWWRVTQVVLPVVLTASLGFVVWFAQTSIQTTLNTQTSQINAELGLRQFLFERRLDAYKQVYDKALAAYSAIKDADAGTNSVQDEIDRLSRMLSELANASRLLSSAELNQLLQITWLQTAQERKVGDTSDLLTKVARQMRKDLKIDEVDAFGQNQVVK
jgi:hypothetical protein